MPTVEPENRITRSDHELHVGMEVPRHTRKQIHNWVQEQEWPEGTKLEHPNDYHVTLLYTPEGHDEHKNAWWLEHMGQTPVKFDKFESFPGGPDGVPYVLRIHSPEIQEHAEKLQDRAEAMGLPITRFPGGYKPHLTVGYGPSALTGRPVPPFEFDIGPSSVSPPRPPKEPTESLREAGHPRIPTNLRQSEKKGECCDTCDMYWDGECWGFGNYDVEPDEVCDEWYPDSRRKSSYECIPWEEYDIDASEPITIEHIASMLESDDIPTTVRMLRAAGWSPTELNVQTCLQCYYELQSPAENFGVTSGELSQRLSAIAEPWEPGSWGKGMLSPMGAPILWKTWGVASDDPTTGYPHHGEIMQKLRYPAGSEMQNAFYINPDGGVEDVFNNFEDKAAFSRAHPALRPIKNSQPSTGLLDYDDPELNFNYASTRCLNCGSDLEAGHCPNCSTVPTQVNSPGDHWPDFGEQPPDKKRDVQFSNDWVWRN